MDCRVGGPRGVRALIVGGLHVVEGDVICSGDGRVTQWERHIWKLWLCQLRKAVFLSRKAATDCSGHCPSLEHYPGRGHCCVLSLAANTKQYVQIHSTLFISLSPDHTVHKCVPPRPAVTASCQENWTHPPAKGMVLNYRADAAHLHAFTPVSITLPFPSLPTTSTAVPWTPLYPSFPPGKYFYSSSLSSPSQHRIYPL